MRCIECKHPETKVMESRELYDGEVIRRRRECLYCNARFTTYEKVELPLISIVKKSGNREEFSREKIANGIYKACEKRDISHTEIEKVISRIERQLRSRNEMEVTTREIGDIILEELAALDDVSYIRFASVYKSFTDIKSFQVILSEIEKKKEGLVDGNKAR